MLPEMHYPKNLEEIWTVYHHTTVSSIAIVLVMKAYFFNISFEFIFRKNLSLNLVLISFNISISLYQNCYSLSTGLINCLLYYLYYYKYVTLMCKECTKNLISTYKFMYRSVWGHALG
jgi:hypothetical protein